MSGVYEEFLRRFHDCQDMYQYQTLIRELGPFLTDRTKRDKLGTKIKMLWFPKKFELKPDMVVGDTATVVFPTISPQLSYMAVELCNVNTEDKDTPVYLNSHGSSLFAFRFILDMKVRDWLEDTPLEFNK